VTAIGSSSSRGHHNALSIVQPAVRATVAIDKDIAADLSSSTILTCLRGAVLGGATCTCVVHRILSLSIYWKRAP
jgi:hypothetical protein